jgi:ABC-type polysaccharide/polyol phosphate export permease
LIRAPLLGAEISTQTWLVTLGCTGIGSLLAFFFFVRVRRRISYWV